MHTTVIKMSGGLTDRVKFIGGTGDAEFRKPTTQNHYRGRGRQTTEWRAHREKHRSSVLK
jgi:hypothetical protein